MAGAIVLLFSTGSRACDACGGGGSSQFLGLQAGAGRSFAGLQYFYSAYRGSFPSAYANRPNESTYDQSNQWRLTGRLSIGDNYRVFVQLPYMSNVRTRDSGSSTVSGIGDISVMAGRLVYTHSSAVRQYLFANIGVKAPTGQYTSPLTTERTIPALQTGNGAWNGLANINYTLQGNKLGVNLDVSGTFTTASSDQYKFGNGIATTALVFYTHHRGRYNIIPQAGIRSELTGQDYFNYQKRWLNDATGGHLAYALAGIQATRGKVGARATAFIPVQGKYWGGEVRALGGFETSIYMLF